MAALLSNAFQKTARDKDRATIRAYAARSRPKGEAIQAALERREGESAQKCGAQIRLRHFATLSRTAKTALLFGPVFCN